MSPCSGINSSNRSRHFVLDDSECEAAAQQEAPTYYQQRPEQAKAKLEKAVRRDR